MPSTLPIATTRDLVTRFHRGVRALRDKRADGRSGSSYDYVAGVTSMALAREAAYIRDVFRADYFAAADGDDLTNLVSQRFKIDRILVAKGPGTATFKRPTAAAGPGTIWAGTRVLVQGVGPGALAYSVASDTPVAAGALYAAGVPIIATKTGDGVAVDTSITGNRAVLDDPLWDSSWTVTHLQCADGTLFEQAPAFRARVLKMLDDAVVGYPTTMALACNAAGAANVAVFGTNVGSYDLGACAVYVGDESLNASTALVDACDLALESWRMLGAHLVVAGMATTPLEITATIKLYDSPSLFDIGAIDRACQAVLRRQIGRPDGYGFEFDDIFGSLVKVTPAIQDVIVSNPLASQGLLVGSPPWFPATLPRYFVPANGIHLTYVGP